MLNNLTIKARLIGILGLMTSLLCGTGFIGFYNTNQAVKSLKVVYQDRIVPLSHLKKVADMYAVNIVDTAHKTRNGSLTWSQGLHNIEDAEKTINEAWNLYLDTSMVNHEKKMVVDAKPLMENANRSISILKEIMRKQDAEAIVAYTIKDMYPVIDPISEVVSKLVDVQVEVAKLDYEAAEAQNSQGHNLALTLISCAILVALLAGFFLLRAITRPLDEAFGYFRRIADGDLNLNIEIHRQDEVTKILEAAKTLQQTLKSLIEQMNYMAFEHDKGAIDVQVDTSKFQGSYKAMAQGVNDMVNGHIAVKKKAMACIKEFGEGNFDAPLEKFPGKKAFINDTIEQVRTNLQALIADTDMLAQAASDGRIQARADASKHQGDFRRIVEGVNATLETIVTPIIVVKAAVDSIDTAAKEISSGNADLSHRTEEQAASLEETAASIEELSSTVKQNADNAKQANQMALAASDVAVRGGNVVQQVVTTMSSINESARKIVDIISVIDGIALQTNILALNAAVEAARAGEQGRGFAVVASEVRNLAQRSAAAAKEIKELISDSVEKVEDGSKLVGEAGKTMDEIVTSVRRVTDIMSEIAAASVEQSSGIGQVNQAITQMDEATQQNAALVEQAAAAAESLEEQAATLKQTVAQFRLDSDGARPAESRRAASRPFTAHKPALRLAASAARPSQQANNDEWTEF